MVGMETSAPSSAIMTFRVGVSKPLTRSFESRIRRTTVQDNPMDY
jgi:hypothetical protein